MYKAYRAGEQDSLPELGVQYADYAEWQREWLSGEVLEEHLACCRRGRSHNFGDRVVIACVTAHFFLPRCCDLRHSDSSDVITRTCKAG